MLTRTRIKYMTYQTKKYPDGSKCYGCGWETQTKYAMADLNIDEDGLLVLTT